MAKNFEVEIKSLLGSKERADKLRKDLKRHYKHIKLMATEKQLNHYFHTPKDLIKFSKKILPLIPKGKKDDFKETITHGDKISIRTRQSNDKVIFVIKASVGSDTSSNGIRRIELEVVMKMKLDKLDRLIIDAGATYQAKWSREREEYDVGSFKVSIDRNAGYGYLTEFEKVLSDEKLLESAHKEILETMKKFDLEELRQDRLERMFDYYNKNWKDYYGTDKTFNIK
jgi:adenylate cyclase class IV